MTALVPFENMLVSKEDVEALLPEPSLCNLTYLFSLHAEQTARAISLYKQVTDPLSMAVMSHFFSASRDVFTRFAPEPSAVFNLEKTIKHIDATFWDKALKSTSIYDVLPAKRKNDWHEAITKYTTPKFDEKTVNETIASLYEQLPDFMAERVDGLYRALSREHVTNRPEGFSARGIFPYGYEKAFNWVSQSAANTLEDLANTIAILNGTPMYLYTQIRESINTGMKQNGTGQWFEVLGLFRMRAYLKGTVHVEVSDDYAWQLNTLLGMANPGSIPEKYRRPKKEQIRKAFSYSDQTIDKHSHQLFQRLSNIRPRVENNLYTYQLGAYQPLLDRQHRKIMSSHLEAIGGALNTHNEISFCYDADPVIKRLVETGKMPERTTYQFYPTPNDIASVAVSAAKIESHHTVLEPSAGQGGIADVIRENHPNAKLSCVELSSLNASVLAAKGHTVEQTDFIDFANKSSVKYDRIIMNPPYESGRYKLHLIHAASLLKEDGVLVAILPSSCIYAEAPTGLASCDTMYGSTRYKFPNTSITVCIKVYRKA